MNILEKKNFKIFTSSQKYPITFLDRANINIGMEIDQSQNFKKHRTNKKLLKKISEQKIITGLLCFWKIVINIIPVFKILSQVEHSDYEVTILMLKTILSDLTVPM